MIDFHTHTVWSDGELIPAELVRRAMVVGYRAIGITDHVDESNMETVISALARASDSLRGLYDITVIPGVEITHAPPAQIPRLIGDARRMGARLVVVHGETPVEPVPSGTNAAAIEGGCDILAHPGFITRQEAAEAARKGIMLEITARKGHSLTNGHVAAVALEAGASLVVDTDTHAPGDLIDKRMAEKVLRGAGLSDERIAVAFKNAEKLLEKLAGGNFR